MNEIILHQLSIGYRHKTVATALSATIRSGELTCLIGRNGLGKSTLLGTLAGFLHPLAGTVVLKIEADYPLHKLPKEQLPEYSFFYRNYNCVTLIGMEGDCENCPNKDECRLIRKINPTKNNLKH